MESVIKIPTESFVKIGGDLYMIELVREDVVGSKPIFCIKEKLERAIDAGLK